LSLSIKKQSGALTVNLGTGVQHLARVVGESGKVDTIFLARNGFRGFAFLDVEDLNSLVVASRYRIVALIVEVERSGVI
jgi:hypothetical protein